MTTRLRKLAMSVVSLAVIVAIAVAASEAGAALWYSVARGGFFYRRPPPPPPAPDVTAVSQSMAHPLFGYVLRPGAPFAYQGHALVANNHGFQSPLSYPYRPAPGEYVVGILGGSVAAGLAYAEAFTGTIARRLEALPALQGRKVVVLNLAIAGFKQPEQIAVLGYYLAAGQKLDAAVSIDGVNELVSGSRNLARDIDETMPPIDVLGPFYAMLEGRTPASASAITATYHARRRDGNRQAADQCRFALCYGWYTILAQWHEREARRGEADAMATSAETGRHLLIYPRNERVPQQGPQAFARLGDMWAASVRAMAGMAAASGVAFVDILQPDQYHRTAREYSPDEAKVAFDATSYIKPPIEQGYPVLLDRLQRLAADGIPVVDATRVFDTEPNPIYIDSCCHVNERGNRILGEFVADAIARRLAKTP